MSNALIDPLKLKIGDVLKSAPDYSNVPQDLIAKQTENTTYIWCNIRRNKKADPASKEYKQTIKKKIDCHDGMLNHEYMFMGKAASHTGYIDALRLYMVGPKASSWIVPIVLLTPTDKRIIDMRLLSGDSSLSYTRQTIPRYEQLLVSKKIRNFNKKKQFGEMQKFRMRWFLHEDTTKRTFKELLTHIATKVNNHGTLWCPSCDKLIGYERMIKDGYTRAGKVFIVCPECGVRLTMAVCPTHQMNSTENPFRLEHI